MQLWTIATPALRSERGLLMARIRTAQQVDDFKARLCQAGEALFAENGPRGVTMRDLAKALGVSAMTPYRYFKNRDDILAAVRASALSRFSDRLEAASALSDDPLQRSHAIGDAYVTFALGQPDAYRLIFDLTQPNEENYPELVRQSARARAILARQARSLVAAGLAPDSGNVAYAIWATAHGVCVLHLAGKYPSAAGCRKAYREAMGWLFRGLNADKRQPAEKTAKMRRKK